MIFFFNPADTVVAVVVIIPIPSPPQLVQKALTALFHPEKKATVEVVNHLEFSSPPIVIPTPTPTNALKQHTIPLKWP